MLKRTHYFFIAIISLSFLGCGETSTKDTEEAIVFDKNCGELETFVVDKAFCRKMGIAEAEFSVKFPKNLKTDPPTEGYQNLHYNYFLKWDENEIQTEGFSIGYSTTQRNTLLKEQLAEQMFTQLSDMWKSIGFELTNEFKGTDSFDGKEYSMYRANGKIDNPEQEFVGDYLIQCLIVEPDVDDKNGVFLMMVANQDSKIKTFEDFSNKGCISTIWKSLKFNY